MTNQKLFQKRAQDYNSDDDEEKYEAKKAPKETFREKIFSHAKMGPNYNKIEDEESLDKDESPYGKDNGEIQSGITKFATDWCTAFKANMKKSKGDDTLFYQHHLITYKLAEEEVEHQGEAQAKTAKFWVHEKGEVDATSFHNAATLLNFVFLAA